MNGTLSPRAATCTDHSHQVHIAAAHRLRDAIDRALIHIRCARSMKSEGAKDNGLARAEAVLTEATKGMAS